MVLRVTASGGELDLRREANLDSRVANFTRRRRIITMAVRTSQAETILKGNVEGEINDGD